MAAPSIDPSITKNPLTAKVGESVRLAVLVHGLPRPTVDWFIGEERLRNGSPRCAILSTGCLHSLVLDPVTLEDTQVRIIASNSSGYCIYDQRIAFYRVLRSYNTNFANTLEAENNLATRFTAKRRQFRLRGGRSMPALHASAHSILGQIGKGLNLVPSMATLDDDELFQDSPSPTRERTLPGNHGLSPEQRVRSVSQLTGKDTTAIMPAPNPPAHTERRVTERVEVPKPLQTAPPQQQVIIYHMQNTSAPLRKSLETVPPKQQVINQHLQKTSSLPNKQHERLPQKQQVVNQQIQKTVAPTQVHTQPGSKGEPQSSSSSTLSPSSSHICKMKEKELDVQIETFFKPLEIERPTSLRINRNQRSAGLKPKAASFSTYDVFCRDLEKEQNRGAARTSERNNTPSPVSELDRSFMVEDQSDSAFVSSYESPSSSAQAESSCGSGVLASPDSGLVLSPAGLDAQEENDDLVVNIDSPSREGSIKRKSRPQRFIENGHTQDRSNNDALKTTDMKKEAEFQDALVQRLLDPDLRMKKDHIPEPIIEETVVATHAEVKLNGEGGQMNGHSLVVDRANSSGEDNSNASSESLTKRVRFDTSVDDKLGAATREPLIEPTHGENVYKARPPPLSTVKHGKEESHCSVINTKLGTGHLPNLADTTTKEDERDLHEQNGHVHNSHEDSALEDYAFDFSTGLAKTNNVPAKCKGCVDEKTGTQVKRVNKSSEQCSVPNKTAIPNSPEYKVEAGKESHTVGSCQGNSCSASVTKQPTREVSPKSSGDSSSSNSPSSSRSSSQINEGYMETDIDALLDELPQQPAAAVQTNSEKQQSSQPAALQNGSVRCRKPGDSTDTVDKTRVTEGRARVAGSPVKDSKVHENRRSPSPQGASGGYDDNDDIESNSFKWITSTTWGSMAQICWTHLWSLLLLLVALLIVHFFGISLSNDEP